MADSNAPWQPGEFTATNTRLLKQVSGGQFQGQAGQGRGFAFLTSNPQYLDAYEALRRNEAGQENFTADSHRKAAFSIIQQSQVNNGGGVSAVTGAALNRQEFNFERTTLGGLPQQIEALTKQLSTVEDERGRANLQLQLRTAQADYDQRAEVLRKAQNQVWERNGVVQAITAQEKALRDVGYKGNFGGDAERYTRLQTQDFQERYNAALETRTQQQSEIDARIGEMGSLRDFLNPGGFSNAGDINGAGVAFDPSIFQGDSELGQRLSELDAESLARLGITAAKGYDALTGTGALNAFAAENLGTAAVSNSFVGPLQPGVTQGATFMELLGGAGTGAGIGSLYAQLTGAKSTGATIGGAAGGAIGAATLGGLSGVSVGATLGSVVPGIGTVIGAVAGAVLGGFFGAGEIHPGATFAGEVADGAFNFDTRSKHMTADNAGKLGESARIFVENLAATTGYTLEGLRLSGGYGGGEYYFNTNYKTDVGTLFSDDTSVNRQFSFDPEDGASIIRGAADVTVDFLSRTDAEVQSLLSEGVQSLDILSAAQARYAAFTGESAAQKEEPPVAIVSTPSERIAASTAAAQTQFESFIKATEEGKTGQAGTILTSNNGLLDRPRTRRRRIVADFTPDTPGFGLGDAAYA